MCKTQEIKHCTYNINIKNKKIIIVIQKTTNKHIICSSVFLEPGQTSDVCGSETTQQFISVMDPLYVVFCKQLLTCLL